MSDELKAILDALEGALKEIMTGEGRWVEEQPRNAFRRIGSEIQAVIDTIRAELAKTTPSKSLILATAEKLFDLVGMVRVEPKC